MARALIFLSLLFSLGFHLGWASAAEPSFPALTGRVVDDAHILDASARTGIERKLADFETKSGRQAIMADLDWNQGNYYGAKPPARGLAVARMVGHITYMSDDSMRLKDSLVTTDISYKLFKSVRTSTDVVALNPRRGRRPTLLPRELFNSESLAWLTSRVGTASMKIPWFWRPFNW